VCLLLPAFRCSGEGSGPTRAMRLRVRCSSAYVLGDLQWCMVHVPEHIRTIRDLAGHVSRLLELNLRGGNGTEPCVSMGGFLVPYGEEVRDVLRDDEIVDVAPLVADCSDFMVASQAPQLPSQRSTYDVNGADAETNGIARDKRARCRGPGANGDAAVAAIGWQPPEESASAKAACAGSNHNPAKKAQAASTSVPAKTLKAGIPKARAVAPPTSSSEEESDEDSSDQVPPPKRSKGSGVNAAAATNGNPACDQQAVALAKRSSERGAVPETAGSGGSGDGDCGLFVGGLPYQLEEADFRKHFEFYGAVVSATIVMNNRTGKPKGFGFIEFAKPDGRHKALADGPNQRIAGKQVEIKPRQSKGGKAEGKSGKDGGKFGRVGKGRDKAGAGGKGPQTADGWSKGREQHQAMPALPSTLATGTNNAGKQNEDICEEEAEVQRQMATLGLPVCFTATQAKADESDDDEDSDQ